MNPDGSPAGKADNYKQALRPLKMLYAMTKAREFGPKSLRAAQQKIVEMGSCRTFINRQVGRLKTCFSGRRRRRSFHERTVYLGPQAQDIIRPHLKTSPQAYIFSPKDTEAWRPGLGGSRSNARLSARMPDGSSAEAFVVNVTSATFGSNTVFVFMVAK